VANYNFVYMGDTWIAKSPTSSVLNYTGEFVFNDALVKAMQQKPRFILHGGDAVFTGDKPSLRYFRNEKVGKVVPTSTPFYVSPGNHDALFTTVNGHTRISFANFKQIIGPLNFTINAPDLKMVVLNTVHIQRDSQGNDRFVYGLTTAQLNFLARALKNSSARFKLVSTHVPPDEWANTPTMNANKARFMRILTNNHVSLVLLSHQHQFRDYTNSGVRFIVSGGAGAALDTLGINELILIKVRGNQLDAQVLPISWLDNRSFPPKTIAKASPSATRRTLRTPRTRTTL
jgi:3',5'-cyclic-AMP phosphodiesterase